MSDAANRIVQKLWSYCNVLRDDGLSYQDYLEQLTFLLFLKMADEQTQPPRKGTRVIGLSNCGSPKRGPFWHAKARCKTPKRPRRHLA